MSTHLQALWQVQVSAIVVKSMNWLVVKLVIGSEASGGTGGPDENAQGVYIRPVAGDKPMTLRSRSQDEGGGGGLQGVPARALGLPAIESAADSHRSHVPGPKFGQELFRKGGS